MATLKTHSNKQHTTDTTHLNKTRIKQLPTSTRLSQEECESLLSEMREAAQQIRKLLAAAN